MSDFIGIYWTEDDFLAMVEEKNRVVRENWRFKGLAGRIKAARAGCGSPCCNIGGGPCADCSVGLAGLLRELESLA